MKEIRLTVLFEMICVLTDTINSLLDSVLQSSC